MSGTKVNVFCGAFNSIEDACLYSEPQWEDEPDENVSDADYFEWEMRNPTHRLKENIHSYLDQDFIETINFDLNYLSNININASDISIIKNMSLGSSFMVLVYEEALGGFDLKSPPASNSFLKYCGCYECDI